MRAVRLFQFDEADEPLSLLPMAARRALDAAGYKLSLAGWEELELEARRELVELGSAREVDVRRVAELLALRKPTPLVREPLPDPGADRVPEDVRAAYGTERPIPDATWAALHPLERYALHKVASRGRPERLDLAYREIIGASALSSHLEPAGGARMVDVGHKAASLRVATAESRVVMNAEAFERLRTHTVPKGDVFSTARLAGILAAKKTADWIPLCHPLSLTKISVELTLDEAVGGVLIQTVVEAYDRTGVEMEALVASSAAALTVYDMLKSFDRGMAIGPTRLLQKSGGRSGDFHA